MSNEKLQELPKVSIIIPVYNGANYLANAIESALNQTYKNTEVIVVNDGSNDKGQTDSIAKSYGNRIRYFSKYNGGVSTALNYGIQQMTGEYFSWLSHDDAYAPNKIADAVDLLKHNECIGKRCMAYTSGYFIDSGDKKIKKMPTTFKKGRVYSGKDAIDIMTRKGTLNGCCLLIPREAFYEVGLFDEKLRYSQDALMWYKLFLAGYKIVADNNQNVMSRIHRNQVSRNRNDLYEHDAECIVKILAPSLAEIDKKSNIYLQYLKRITKHQCDDAINYMLDYAKSNSLFSFNQKCQLAISIKTSGFRYAIVRVAKQILFKL